MSLLLPFALQWSLGGFRASSAVGLWGLALPVGALLFLGARQAVPWFLAFAGLVAFSAGIDPALAADAARIPGGVVVMFFALNILGVSTTAYVLLQFFVRARERALADSERLLLNVLPPPVAIRLKQSDEVIADGFAAATVLFADLVAFTELTQRLAQRMWLCCWTKCSLGGIGSPLSLRGRKDQDDWRCLHGGGGHSGPA